MGIIARVVALWVMNVVPFISSPKVFFGTSWTIWMMRKEIGMIRAWTSLGFRYVTASGKKKERVTCQMCDRLMNDIMEAAEDVVDIPCGVMCLKWGSCIEMCEKLKDISENSDSYPCIEGGYCPEDGWFDDELADLGYNVPDCHFEGGIQLKCEPNTHCHKVFKGLRFQCKMKPGAAKWVGMQRSMASSAGVLTSAMKKWPRCSEDGASQFCIAEPTGTAYIAEIISNTLIFGYGGYKSIVAVTTSGGDDDQQMLVFWLIITFFLHIEGFFRVLMSQWFPPYFEMKCIFIIWLMFFDGTEKIFRSLLIYWDDIRSFLGFDSCPEEDEIKELNKDKFINAIDGSNKLDFKLPIVFSTWYKETYANDRSNATKLKVVGRFERYYKKKNSLRAMSSMALNSSREYYTGWSRSNEDLIYLYRYIHANRDMLHEYYGTYHWWQSVVEATASCVSFHPKFLKISLRRAYDIPSMDGEHKDSDVYAVIMLECPSEGPGGYKRTNSFTNLASLVGIETAKMIQYGKVRSTTKFDTSSPVWNEDFEIQLEGGTINSAGLYQNHLVQDSTLIIQIQDEDYWQVSMFFQIASAMLTVFIPVLFFISIFEYPYFTTQERLIQMLGGEDGQGHPRMVWLVDLGMTIHTNVSKQFRMSDGRPATKPFMILFCCIVVFQLLRILWNKSTEKDDLIGYVRIPLRDLLDQQEHYYQNEPLMIEEEEEEEDTKTELDTLSILDVIGNNSSDSSDSADGGSGSTTQQNGGGNNNNTKIKKEEEEEVVLVKNEKIGKGRIDFAVRLLEA